jgi:hypothetical protein
VGNDYDSCFNDEHNTTSGKEWQQNNNNKKKERERERERGEQSHLSFSGHRYATCTFLY